MPSYFHEALIDLFRNYPELAPELLRSVLQVALPSYHTIELEPAEFGQLTPVQFHADLVLRLDTHKPALGIVLEVQLQRDEAKLYSWPLYLTHLRNRLRCPTCLLIVAPDASVAQWCAASFETGHPHWQLTPFVIGPKQMPVVTDPQQATLTPELAVLSAMTHGSLEVVLAAMAGIRDLDKEKGKVCIMI